MLMSIRSTKAKTKITINGVEIECCGDWSTFVDDKEWPPYFGEITFSGNFSDNVICEDTEKWFDLSWSNKMPKGAYIEKQNKIIGFTTRDISENETIATLNPVNGEVRSDVIKFRPYGKKNLMNAIFKRIINKI